MPTRCLALARKPATTVTVIRGRGQPLHVIMDEGCLAYCDAGVGISGQEGMQAVMSSDFSIAQFRYLETLLLVHGRWSYARITRMVLFFFYKNLLFGLTLFYFNCLCFFSGQTLYNGGLAAVYLALTMLRGSCCVILIVCLSCTVAGIDCMDVAYT